MDPPNNENKKDYDYRLKILLIGDSGVGKTSTLLRFTENIFSECAMATVGTDFKINNITLGEKIISLMIWDSAGQERFRSITSAYYKKANGILLFFDLTSLVSFENLSRWIKEIKNNKDDLTKIVIIGNKCDLENLREVEKEKAENFANENGCKYFEISAKEGTNIDKIFYALSNEIIKDMPENNQENIIKEHVRKIDKIEKKNNKTSCC